MPVEAISRERLLVDTSVERLLNAAIVLVCTVVLGTQSCRALADSLRQPRLGFSIQTQQDNSSLARDAIVVRYEGEIAFPMASNLAEIWQAARPQFRTLHFELDSSGGLLPEAEKAVATLQQIRRTARLETIVRQGDRCLSACVLLFAQGETRSAGGASVWMFHGACSAFSNVPAAEPTHRYVEILREAGVSPEFLCLLSERGYLSSSGKLWASGYELHHVYKSNVITRLLDGWQPEAPVEPPFDPQVRSR